MDNTRQDSRLNAHSVTGMPTIQQTSRGTQTGAAITTQVASIAQVAITTQSDSFELFGKLPPELKIKILNIAAREVSRLIEMTTQETFQGHTPALLGVSHMARKEASKFYVALRPGSPQPVYFNPDNDTLMLIMDIESTVSRICLFSPPALTPTALTPIA
ncbi:hypothetical protein BPAE_0143g00290 [Botrytis paeoniae]|uniref:2EXR domain-containing protein n=1 Tax=Botrytis paeoniae TaxID=278948 RepID=A0A4Z1FNG5_9HELO|nr:hypothetical protein BPAE_0143g00290 [Botrytis paeoniae]